MLRFRDQAERFGAEYLTAKATRVDFSSRPFKVWVGDDQYEADAMIVSTGAQSLMLDLEAESRLIGHGLSTCATCDGFFFRGQEIAVVGGGDSALEEALVPDQVRRARSRCSIVAIRCGRPRSCRSAPSPTSKIEFRWSSVVTALLGDDSLTGARVEDVRTGAELRPCPLNGLFVAIGHRPNTDLFKGMLDMDDNGYLVTQSRLDVHQRRGRLRLRRRAGPHVPPGHQAAGSGCMAAIDVERWLEATRHR